MAPLNDKIVIITGGTGSLGQAVTRAFLDAGAQVVVLYNNEAHLHALVDKLGGAHKRLTALRADVLQETQVTDAVQQVFDAHGRVDVLVNLVGGYLGDIPVVHTEETTWDHTINVNLKSTFLCCKAALVHMLDQESGKIINVGARGALHPVPGSAAYAVAKAGVHTLTHAIAEEVRGKNINVNAVVPGFMDTDANRRTMPEADHSQWVKPEQLATVILFLASDEAKAVHGALVPVYGKA
jgi:NAD(P)-dependent dehydrogenase (short-subunit alcohol dehydrogenase family)